MDTEIVLEWMGQKITALWTWFKPLQDLSFLPKYDPPLTVTTWPEGIGFQGRIDPWVDAGNWTEVGTIAANNYVTLNTTVTYTTEDYPEIVVGAEVA